MCVRSRYSRDNQYQTTENVAKQCDTRANGSNQLYRENALIILIKLQEKRNQNPYPPN